MFFLFCGGRKRPSKHGPGRCAFFAQFVPCLGVAQEMKPSKRRPPPPPIWRFPPFIEKSRLVLWFEPGTEGFKQFEIELI